MDREAEKSAIQKMEADYRLALEFSTTTLVSLHGPPDHHNGMSMAIDDNGVFMK